MGDKKMREKEYILLGGKLFTETELLRKGYIFSVVRFKDREYPTMCRRIGSYCIHFCLRYSVPFDQLRVFLTDVQGKVTFEKHPLFCSEDDIALFLVQTKKKRKDKKARDKKGVGVRKLL